MFVIAPIMKHGNADGDGDSQAFRGRQPECMLSQCCADALGNFASLSERCLRKQDDKLFAAVAGDDVVGTELQLNQLRGLAQHFFTGMVGIWVYQGARFTASRVSARP